MLYIETKDRSFVHNTGMKLPKDLRIAEIVSISASSTELEEIKEEVSGIPITRSSLVEWYGDHAKFIVSNVFDV